MKPSINLLSRLLLFVLLLIAMNTNAQWNPLTSGTTNIINGLYFVDDNIGYTAETGGGIRKTTDGGATWVPQSSGTGSTLANIWFTGALTGIAIGDNSTILRTTDGGANWNPVASPLNTFLRGLWFVDANLGFISGGNPGSSIAILKTIDGGQTWTNISPTNGFTSTNVSHSICFTDANNGYACNWDGRILKTTDGGATWNTTTNKVSNNHLMSIFFVDALTGFCAGGDFNLNTTVILKTIDAGANWTAINNPYPSVNFLSSIEFSSPTTGYAAGGNVQSNNAVILKTTDAGVTWAPDYVNTNTNTRLARLSIPSTSVGYACGLNGIILKTGCSGPEICNGLDDNCDGVIDEGLSQGFQFNYSFSCVSGGTTVNITWTGGCPSWNVDISLALVSTNTGVLSVATNLPNTGSYSWTVPANLPPANYFFYVPGASSGGNGIHFNVSSNGVNQDYNALMALYNATNGPNWNNNTGWGTDCNVCNWHGVACFAGRVVFLDLRSNNLTGTLPSQLEDLTKLELLYLFINNLSGTIPPEIGNLANLKHLSLATNQLTGTIPPEIGNLTQMIGMGFEGNQLTGGIPSTFKNLNNLELLYLYLNQLSGTIQPELGNLPKLQTLSLSSNQFSGCFPATLNNLCGKVTDFSNNPALPGGGSNAAFQAFCATGIGGGVVINSVTTLDETCLGFSDGSIIINATTHGGTLLYSIDGGTNYGANNTFNNLTPGSYPINVKSQGITGCDATDNVTIMTGPPKQTWFKDLDNDGYSDGITQLACSAPVGYKLPGSLTATNGDCNDNNADQFPGQTWYKDQDNDGYSDGTSLAQCLPPTGYKTANQLIATNGDCKDGTGTVPGAPSASMANVYPGATELCNGIDDDCNGSIDDNVPIGATYTGNLVFTSQAQINAFPNCYSTITGSVIILGAGITSLANLSNITSITGNLSIQSTGLLNLNGLNNLGSIGGSLLVYFNTSLTSLTGIENLNTVAGALQVYYNFQLSACCAIEHFLISGGVGGSTLVFFNKTGCNNTAEILNTCPLFAPPTPKGDANKILSDAGKRNGWGKVFPNPTSGAITLRFDHAAPKNGQMQILDLWGRVVHLESLVPGLQECTLSIAGLLPGVYFVKVLDEGVPVWVEKVIKQ